MQTLQRGYKAWFFLAMVEQPTTAGIRVVIVHGHPSGSAWFGQPPERLAEPSPYTSILLALMSFSRLLMPL
ncbi:hypothetical protein AB0B30_32025 [Streptomyces narbonensis]|uniref:Transposase n=1 Tax=Streptomyces narbonensis TaxID=67333 RepID=A0ABV3CGW3_9ACTN